MPLPLSQQATHFIGVASGLALSDLQPRQRAVSVNVPVLDAKNNTRNRNCMSDEETIRAGQTMIDSTKKGAVVEFASKSNPRWWIIATNPVWDWLNYNFRIAEPKPEVPKELWAVAHLGGNLFF